MGWRESGTAWRRTSSRIVSNGKLTLWQETLNSTAAISPGLRLLVDRLNQAAQLLRGEAAHRDDPVLRGGARVVLLEVPLDPDVAPAEGIHPAGVHLAQRAAVHLQHGGELCEAPVLAKAEMAFARLNRQRSGGDGAEALQRNPLGDGAQPVQDEPVLRRAIAKEAGRCDQPVAETDPVEVDRRHEAAGAQRGPGRSADQPADQSAVMERGSDVVSLGAPHLVA